MGRQSWSCGRCTVAVRVEPLCPLVLDMSGGFTGSVGVAAMVLWLPVLKLSVLFLKPWVPLSVRAVGLRAMGVRAVGVGAIVVGATVVGAMGVGAMGVGARGRRSCHR